MGIVFDPNKYVFPIVSGKRLEPEKTKEFDGTVYDGSSGEMNQFEGELTRPVTISQIHGTCFNLGKGFYLTAGHVLTEALDNDYRGMGVIEGGRYKGYEIKESEVLEEIDVGVLKTDLVDVSALPWLMDTRPSLTDITTCGFPFALNMAVATASLRAFKGYIVSSTRDHRYVGRPLVYELSFACPRGLSGAPLWFGDPLPEIGGMVLGSSVTEITVHSEKVTDSVIGKESYYEKTEAMHLGTAIQMSEILQKEFKILGGSMINFLESQK